MGSYFYADLLMLSVGSGSVFVNPGSTELDAVSRGPSLYCQDHLFLSTVSADANQAPLFHSEAFYKQNDQILPFLFLFFPPLKGWFRFL